MPLKLNLNTETDADGAASESRLINYLGQAGCCPDRGQVDAIAQFPGELAEE